MNDAATLSDGYEGMELPFYLKLLERDYRGALALSHGKAPPGGGWDEWIASDHGRRALASRLLGDSAAARDQFDSSRTELEAQLRAGRQRSPRDYDLTASVLAIADAGLGRRSEARALAQEVLASDPPSVDAIAGPLVLQNVAYSYVLLGEPTKALDIIERILAMPAAVSRPLLRLDPRWETLRGNPRFQRLVRDGT
jgi:tetratricopeptide (TPR) repeat protein